jgi:hypothetical protein
MCERFPKQMSSETKPPQHTFLTSRHSFRGRKACVSSGASKAAQRCGHLSGERRRSSRAPFALIDGCRQLIVCVVLLRCNRISQMQQIKSINCHFSGFAVVRCLSVRTSGYSKHSPALGFIRSGRQPSLGTAECLHRHYLIAPNCP